MHFCCTILNKPKQWRIPCFTPCLFQAESSRLREHLNDQEEKLKISEETSERKDKRLEELQRLLGGMEQESATLREAIRNREEELRELRKIREEGQKGEQRSANTHDKQFSFNHWQSTQE